MHSQKEKRNQKEDVVRAQLILRAIAWDVSGIGRAESAKLQREIEYYHIQELEMAHGQLDTDDIPKKYRKMQQSLHEAKIMETDALLVSDDAGLADYVYHLEQGMAVVYYEKEGGRQAVSADMIVQGLEEIGVQFMDRVLKRKRHLPWNILYTRRTCIREITLQDLDELFELYAGEGITEYTEPLFERAKEEEYTRSYIECMYYYYGYGMWVVRGRENGELIGRAGIEHRDEGGTVLMELGYVIGREYHNQGYATEVCQAILEYAKCELGMEEMHCFIHPQNLPSLRVAQKLGFALYGGQGSQDGMLHYKIKFHS